MSGQTKTWQQEVGKVALMHVDFFSDVLGMGMNMDVILPQKTSKQIGMEGMAEDGSYKTVYLLHGMSDDHTVWQRRTAIERYMSRLGIAVVMPSTHLGFYDRYNLWDEVLDVCFRGAAPDLQGVLPAHVK